MTATWHDHPNTLFDHLKIAMVRNPTFRPTSEHLFSEEGLYLQLGPGEKFIKGWVNIDFPDWDGDNDPLPYASEVVDGIASYHTLDHLARPIAVLAEIQRVLKPGGWFVNVVPHYSSELWHADLTHKSQFAIETWRSIFSTRHYDHQAVDGHVDWRFSIEFNMMMAFEERNAVLVTKLVKK